MTRGERCTLLMLLTVIKPDPVPKNMLSSALRMHSGAYKSQAIFTYFVTLLVIQSLP